MHERGADGDDKLSGSAGDPTEGAGIEAAVKGLAVGQLLPRGVARAAADRRRRVQCRLRKGQTYNISADTH